MGKRESISFKQLDFGGDGYHWIVECELQQQRGWLVVDTGASRTVMDQYFVGNVELHLHPDSIVFGFDSEQKQISTATIENLLVGSYCFPLMEVAVANLDNLKRLYHDLAGINLVGILGCDFMVQHTTSLNIRQKRIFLKNTHIKIE